MSVIPGGDSVPGPYIVSVAGIGADPAKCQQVRDWPVPRDLHYVHTTEDIFRASRSWLPPCMSWRPKERISNGPNGGTRHSAN